MSSRYAQVDRCLWVDAKFLGLSSAPNAQTLFLWLLTSPEAGIIPGLIRIGLAGLAEAIGWSTADVSRYADELGAAGMVRVDWKARLVWLPKALARNLPKAPQNMSPWSKAWAEIPECALKAEAWSGMVDTLATVKADKPEWATLFESFCPHPDVRVPSARVTSQASRAPEAMPGAMPPTMPGTMGGAMPGAHKQEHEHKQEQEQEQPKPRAMPPAAPAPALSESEQDVLEALAAWPSLAALANADMVRQIRATAGPAGWSPDDVLAGIADLGTKQGMADAASGTLDPGKLAAKLSGFIKSANLDRRSGGKEAPAPTRGGGSGTPRRQEVSSPYGDPTAEDIARMTGRAS